MKTQHKLEMLRDQLSDLSMRNRSLRLVRLYKKSAFDIAALDELKPGRAQETLDKLLSSSKRATKLVALLSGDESEQTLSDGLKYLHRDVRLVREDRGLEDLALGWPFISGSLGETKFVQCPLFLFPCVLDRKATGGAGSWTARVDPSELQVNRTFFLALAKTQGLRVSDDDLLELQAWAQGEDWSFEDVCEKLRSLGLRSVQVGTQSLGPLPQYARSEYPTPTPGRFELNAHAVISRFPLADTALLEDYEQLILKLDANPDELSGFAGALLGDGRRVEPQPTDRENAWWHITDMDDSQEDVVQLALGGSDLAVEGPPGTGKSQLIVNVIAATLATNPKARVLVVSQKRAALDVVYQRLGPRFQPFAVKVHDATRERKATFKQIHRDILETQNRVLKPGPKRSIQKLSEELAWFGEVHGGVEKADYAARASHTVTPPRELVGALKSDLTEQEVRGACWLARSAASARTPGTWRERRPDYADLDQDDLDLLLERGTKWAAAIQAVEKKAAERPSRVSAVRERFDEWRRIRAWVDEAGAGDWTATGSLASLKDPRAAVTRDDELVRRLTALRQAAQGRVVQDPSFAEKVRWWLAEGQGFFSFLKPRSWGAENELGATFDREDIPPGETPQRCETWLKRLEYTNAIGSATFEILKLDPAAFTAEEAQTRLQIRQELAQHVASYRALGVTESCPTTTHEFKQVAELAKWATSLEKLEKTADAAERQLKRWVDKPRRVLARMPAFQAEVEKRFDELVGHDIGAREFGNTFLLALATKTLASDPAGGVEATLLAALAERRLRNAEKANPVLRQLTLTSSERHRAELARSWSGLAETNAAMLSTKLLRRARDANSVAAMDSRAGKGRQRWTLRRFVTEFWEKGLSDIKPVWLCSPDAVAALFEMRQNRFDLVIFDEASQCTLESAVTVIYRGKRCLIAGDEQQLPPSRFFSSAIDGDGDDAFELPESLLARAKESAVVRRLNWHYRAQFPELIQFSNTAYYEGTLRVAPNPGELPSPVAFHRVDGLWQRTRNEAEAAHVVALLDAVLRDHPGFSVGVITFNRAQAHCIQDAIDERGGVFKERWDAAMDRTLEERPFVRNLENVQGDERDIIILSVGYAPTKPGGAVAKRFGVLSQAGGERRLNVAVSRARQKMEVVCSFDPSTQLDVSDSKSEGARRLKEYLCFAQAAGRRGDVVDVPNPVAVAMAEALRKRGFECATSVGPSASKVDLAVRRPGQRVYPLGVVLDTGVAAWGKDPAAIELHRPRFLARYQWNVLHVPVRSWIRERDKVLECIVSRVDGRVNVVDPPEVRVRAATHASRVATPTPQQAPRTPRVASARPVTPAAPRHPTPPRVAPEPVVRPEVPAEPMVRPGSRVEYRNNEDGSLRTIVIAGLGQPGLPLETPLALALLDAEVGETVTMELADREVELTVIRLSGP